MRLLIWIGARDSDLPRRMIGQSSESDLVIPLSMDLTFFAARAIAEQE